MLNKKSAILFKMAVVLVSAVLATGTAFADREIVTGYATDTDGTIIHDSAGNCVRTKNWTPEKAVVVGCDGVVLKAPTETYKGGSSGVGATFLIPSASLFELNSAELTEQGKEDLKAYRAKIKPELAQAIAAVIVGHSDSTGSEAYNIKLSKRRAEAVRDYLIEGGVSPGILRVVGWGSKDPIASNDTEAGRAENRRVEVVVYGEARGLDVLRFPSVALFPRKGSNMTSEGMQLLSKNIEEAKSKLSRAVYIEIVGHTDDVGDKKENQNLSELRAWAVSDTLIKVGVDPNKIMTVGVGASEPIASNQTEEGRAQNRRVEVLVLGRKK